MSKWSTIIPPEIIAEAGLLGMVERREVKEPCPVVEAHSCDTLRILVNPLVRGVHKLVVDKQLKEVQQDAMSTYRRIIHDELGVPYDDVILGKDPYYPIWIYYCPICEAHFCPEFARTVAYGAY